METYRVNIQTPGHMIIFRGKRARTPVSYSNVLEKEIPILDAQARRSMLKYQIIKESDIVRKPLIEIRKKDEDIEVESLSEKEEPSTILDKLLHKNT